MFYVVLVATVGLVASLWGVATSEHHALLWWATTAGFFLIIAFALQFMIDT